MSVISTICPYCHTKNTSFTSVAESKHTQSRSLYSVFYRCNHCENCIVAQVQTDVSPSPHNYKNDLEKCGFYHVVCINPKAESIQMPEYIPENISNFYRQAADNLRNRNWDACGAMCRKVLDVSTKQFSQVAKLAARIDDLARKNIIVDQLKEWAHTIRLEGNNATHDAEPYTEYECKDLLNFTYMYLHYVYTMPEMLAAKKKEAENVSEKAGNRQIKSTPLHLNVPTQ